MDHDHATSVLHVRRSAALAVGGVLAAAALSGCSVFGGSSTSGYSGPAVPAGSARAGQPAELASPTATGSAAAAASASAAAAAASAKGVPYIEAIKQKGCTPTTFVERASLVSGAIHVYITKPLGAGSVPASARTQAASAAAYAAKNLGAGAAAVRGCSTASFLTSISTQDVAQLQRLSSELAKGNVPAATVQAVDALFADVLAQAKRLNLTIVERTPSPHDLAGT